MSTPAAVKPIRVLLVEDNPGDARLILELLREVGADAFDVERVDRLEPALKRLGSAGIDVVLLDLGLPDSQGIATFERTQRGARSEPIIVISGLDDEELALAAVRSGAQDYLVKGRIEGLLLGRVIRYAIERQRTDARLRLLTLAVDQSPASVFITDPRGTIEYVNRRFTEVTGYSAAEAIGQSPRLLQSGRTPPEYYQQLWTTILAGDTWQAEIQNRRKSGEVYWDAVVISPIRDPRGGITHFIAVHEDITERKQAETALANAAERLRALMDHAHDGIAVLSLAGVIQEVNPRMGEIAGLAHDEIVGRHIATVLSDPDAATKVAEFQDVIAQGRGTVLGVAIKRPDGKTALVDFSLSTIPIKGENVVLSIGREVTQQRALETQLRQAQKMEAVGRLAGGVAHDFNNILTAIFGYADLVAEEFPEGSPQHDDINEIRKAAQRATALTRQLLAFSRQQVLQPVVLNLNDLVEETDNMLRRLIGEDVELRLALSADLGNVRADPGELQQVVMNLVVNARDAMPTGGKLVLETANTDLTEDYAELHRPVVPGRYVLIAVSDTGIGMNAETMARIFEPFFTTKEKGKGTGLGLSTVYGIVKQSGGYVWVYSEPGGGTTFKIYLPRVDEPTAALAPPPQTRSLVGTETIVLAEDDEVLRPLAKGLLEKLGYTVIAAANAADALALTRAHGGPIHLLLTDVVMPGGSGPELAKRLAETHPGAKVLYASGYTDDAIVRHGMLEPGLNFLQKPFTPTTLARKVRDVLDAR